jgi:hypothetical protein
MASDKDRINSRKNDLPDSPADREKLKREETTIDMPDVKDIPGQEHVNVPVLSGLQDSTISSGDEEGEGIWDNEANTDTDSTVTDMERKLLRESAEDMPTNDDVSLRRAELDNKDDDGDLLNEKSSANSISGSDLDIPGANADDEDEDNGEEDEENNSYSLGGDNQSENEERSGT